MGLDVTLNTETHKNSVRIKAPNSVNASKRKHKNQNNHYNKQRQVLMANFTVCQSKWKPIVEPWRAKPKTYHQAQTHWLKFYEKAVIESEASFHRQHLFPKMLPLKWICCCKESYMDRMVCENEVVLSVSSQNICFGYVRIASVRRF